MNLTEQCTLANLVVEDFRAAGVLHRFGIDFCCSGWRSVADACRQRRLDPGMVLSAVAEVCCRSDSELPKHTDWTPRALIAFIVGTHHASVRAALPPLVAQTRAIAAAHGHKHPDLHEAADLMARVSADLTLQMAHEERVLFPHIEALADAAAAETPAPRAWFGRLENPIRMMEEDHELTGAAMARIRAVTGDYAMPEDGCVTYRACMEALAAFERDLRAHVHLENNVLFPKARALAARPPA